MFLAYFEQDRSVFAVISTNVRYVEIKHISLRMTMLTKRLLCLRNFNLKRSFHQGVQRNNKREHPISRTFRILKDDVKYVFSNQSKESYMENLFPSHVDILIIGGGAIGSSIAYWIKEKTGPKGLNMVVVEKDGTVNQLTSLV